jgi:hypothetical protein
MLAVFAAGIMTLACCGRDGTRQRRLIKAMAAAGLRSLKPLIT